VERPGIFGAVIGFGLIGMAYFTQRNRKLIK
jgi:hypothetical protein